jgi:uncharacterized protein (DUF1697 family)
MTPRILLLRGVNVGGVKLPMVAYRDMLTGLGLADVRSYIQSGNAVFKDPGLPDLAGAVAAGLKADFGLSSALFFYEAQGFDSILAECPFAVEGDAAGAKVHVVLLAEPAQFDHAALMALATTERFALTDRALYLHAPDGVGHSALFEKLPRFVKGSNTARNWNTMRALSEMVKA